MAADEFDAWSQIIAAHYPPAMAEWFMATRALRGASQICGVGRQNGRRGVRGMTRTTVMVAGEHTPITLGAIPDWLAENMSHKPVEIARAAPDVIPIACAENAIAVKKERMSWILSGTNIPTIKEITAKFGIKPSTAGTYHAEAVKLRNGGRVRK